MDRDEWLRLLAGIAVLAGTALTWLVSPWWLLLLAFVGLNLLQSGLTRWCPAMWVLDRCGVARRCDSGPKC